MPFDLLLSLGLAAATMTVIVALRYVVASSAFAWIAERKRRGYHGNRGGQIRREVGASLGSALVYGIPAGIVGWGWTQHGWTRIYTSFDAQPLWYLPLSVLIYLFAHDTWFYWTHRAMHRPAVFRRMHATHHASNSPTAFTAMSFHPSEAATGAVVIPLLVFLVPIHIAMLGIVLATMTIMGTTNHMGCEIFPRRFVESAIGRWLITASHHQKHHEHYRCNYGLYFRFWDRVCGTDRGLAKCFRSEVGQGRAQ